MTLYRIIGYGRSLIRSPNWIDLTDSQLSTEELSHLRELALKAGYSIELLRLTALSEDSF